MVIDRTQSAGEVIKCGKRMRQKENGLEEGEKETEEFVEYGTPAIKKIRIIQDRDEEMKEELVKEKEEDKYKDRTETQRRKQQE